VDIAANTVKLQTDVEKVNAQLDKIPAAASKVASALAGAFTVGAITAAVSKFAEFTGHLADMEQKTGIGAEALQTLQMHFDQAGVSIDTVTGAIGKMGRNLVEGGSGTVQAVERLGLSLGALQTMSPDRAFIVLGDAIAGIQNPMERTKLAMDLFGKSGVEILAGLDGKLAESTEAFKRMGLVLSEDVVQAGDKFGDTMTVLKTSGMALLAQVLTPMLPALTWLAQKLGELAGSVIPWMQGAFTSLIVAGLKVQLWLYEFAASISEAGAKIPLLGKALGMTADSSEAFRAKAQEMKDVIAGMTVELPKHEAALKKIPPVLDEHTKALKGATDAGVIWGEGFAHAVHEADAAGKLLHDSLEMGVEVFGPFDTALENTSGLLFTGTIPALAKANEEALKWAQTNGAVLAPSIVAVGSAADESATKTNGWQKAVQQISQSFDTLSGAFSQLAQVAGGKLGSVVQAIGTLVASINLAMKSGAEMRKGFDTLREGGIANVISGLATMAAGAASAAAALLQATASTRTAQNVMGGFMTGMSAGAVFGPWGAAIGGIAGALTGLFRTGANRAREAAALAADAAKKAAEAAALAIQKLIDDTKSQIDGLKSKLSSLEGDLDGLIGKAHELGYEFDRAGNLIGINFDKLRDTTDKYGINIDALGPKFQQLRLDQVAAALINDFTLMAMAGGDVGTILDGMAPAINRLVQDSIKFGTTIPENMRPWIQNLIDAGRLTDAAGNKITSLDQIKFGPSIETQFETIQESIKLVVKAIQDVIAQIADLVAKLDLLLAPKDLVVNKVYNDPGAPPGFYDVPGGGDPALGPAGGFAAGTFGTLGQWFGNFGAGTRTVLHGSEAVVRRDQVPAFVRAHGGRSAPAPDMSATEQSLNDIKRLLQGQAAAFAYAVREAVAVGGTR